MDNAFGIQTPFVYGEKNTAFMVVHDFAGKMCLLDSGMRADIEGNDLQMA